MKHLSLFSVLSIFLIGDAYAEPYVSQICHADPEYVKYNYAGLWERDSYGNFICNYWKFLSDEEAANALTVNESDSEYIETDSDSEILEDDYHDDYRSEDEYSDEVMDNIPDDE